MARIPVVTSRISANTGRTAALVGSRRSTADDFGAQIGASLQELGAGVADLGRGIEDQQNAKRQRDLADAVAQSDFTPTELEIRNTMGPDASGYRETVLEAYDVWVDERAEAIEDGRTRQAFVDQMTARRNTISARAAQYEFGTANQYATDQANASLSTIDNKIRTDPANYATFVSDGEAVIDARPGLNPTLKSAMKRRFREGAALSRFEGVIEAAVSPEEIEAIRSQVDDEQWQRELSSQGTERVLGLLDAKEKTLYGRNDSAARSVLSSIEERSRDVTTVVPKDEIIEAERIVRGSNDPALEARMARVARDEEIKKQTKTLTPAQQRQIIETRYATPMLPPVLDTAITRAAQMFGVSPAYLAATAQREYGLYLKGDPDKIDWGKKNAAGASSASGVMQFTDGTWWDVVRDPAFQKAAGIDATNMSKDELMALRDDPNIAVLGGGYFTAKNARVARAALGREPTDQELYIMHFMGRSGGPEFFRALKSDPTAPAADLFSSAAKANPTIYFNKDGSKRSMREVYTELGRKHGSEAGAETYVQYGDRQTRERILEQTERRLAEDPMAFAQQTGVAAVSDLSAEGGIAERGVQARAVAEYYGLSVRDMKPFTKDEAAALTAQIEDGNADRVLQIITSVQQMGGDVARAALSQISVTSNVYAYAGGLQLETGRGATAADVVRGQKRLEENPDLLKSIGVVDTDVSAAFLQATEGALLDAAPSQRQTIMEAALAHYTETSIARGRSTAFDPEAFETSVQAVLGGVQGSPALDSVNGSITVLPPGVSASVMEDALEAMTVADWTTMSREQLPPRYLTGGVADPEDIAAEGVLRSIGGGEYKIAMSDGSFLITGRPSPNGQLEPYIFRPSAEGLRGAISEAATPFESSGPDRRAMQLEDIQAAEEDGVLTPEEQQALTAKYGAMWRFDENGQRIGQQ